MLAQERIRQFWISVFVAISICISLMPCQAELYTTGDRLSIDTLLGLTLIFVCSPLHSQTIYDLGEINGDLRILGDQRYDSVGGKEAISVFDFNDDGPNDLFLIQGDHGSIYGFFDVDFEQPNSFIDMRYSQPDLYMPFNISAHFAFDRLYSLDLNGDGIDDLITASMNSYTISGDSSKVFVLFGSQSWLPDSTIDFSIEPADLTILYGSWEDVYFGNTMTSGDYNNDGIDDLAIGAFNALNPKGLYKGAVYVVFGSTNFPPNGAINFGKEPADLTFYGGGGNGDFGYDVAAGDVNGDGIDDLIVGALNAEVDKLGRVYVFFGSDDFPPGYSVDLTYESADVTIIGPHFDSNFGRSVTSGDINGDGIDDICGGGDDVISPGGIETGAAYLVYGRTDFPPQATIDLGQTMADITCYGEREDSNLGVVMKTGDMDGDGLDEWAFRALLSGQAPNFEGSVYILQGSADYQPNQVINLDVQQPTIAFYGDDENDSLYLSGDLTDTNQNGLDDLLLGAPGASREDADRCGEAYIILSSGTLNGPPRYMAGPGPAPGNDIEVRLYDPFYPTDWNSRFYPYPSTGYGVNVAAGDLDGDGYEEIITGPGPGQTHQPIVAGFTPQGDPLFEFLAYGAPKYGVIVAASDLDGNGVDEIITGAGPGDVYGPHVRGWRWDGESTVLPMPGVSFLAYGTHRWGVNVVCGDIDGDGNDEIITGAGPGDVFGPHVRGWDVDGGTATSIPAVSYFAYGTLHWGVNVACGDIDGDGIAEIVTGPGPSEMFSSHVRGWDYDGDTLRSIPGVNFIAYSGFPHSMGCMVACGDADNDRVAEILTAPGPHPDNPAYLKTWNYDGDELTLVENKSFLVFEEGDYVAGARIALGNPYQHPSYLP